MSARTKSEFLVIQSKPQDLSKMVNVIVIRQALETSCKTTDQPFKENMYTVTKLVLKIGVEISMPRTCGR